MFTFKHRFVHPCRPERVVVCLAQSNRDSIIYQASSTPQATVNDLIRTGSWSLPVTNLRHHHNQNLRRWINSFDYPTFNLTTEDSTFWNGTPLRKLRTRHIWDSIRFKRPEVPWHTQVWHKLKVIRYAHHQWLVCQGRLNTFARLAHFGIDLLQHCLLCVGGIETSNHLMNSCSYSSFVLRNLAGLIGSYDHEFATWNMLLAAWGSVDNQVHKSMLLLSAQVFSYHIWRERNARLHGKRCLDPNLLLAGIVIDIKARLSHSTWFVNIARNSVHASWLG